jgi:hypothetical protein
MMGHQRRWRSLLRDLAAVVIGFDVDPDRIGELQADFDHTGEVEKFDLSHPTLS